MDNCKISLIVIGFNTRGDLKKLLLSINNQEKIDPNNLEVIYIDDGSIDGSFSLFQEYKLAYKKRGYKIPKNCGRAVARSYGVSLAAHSWLMFSQSNVTFSPNTIYEYLNVLNTKGSLAWMGRIVYSSSDKVFENYLNHPLRGINKYKNNMIIDYKYLIFGNCVIARDVFKVIQMRHSFTGYGGAELDFASRFNYVFPQKIRCCKRAVVFRNNHPGFLAQCNRFFEYGKHNFYLLSFENKKLLLGKFVFLQFSVIMQSCCVFLLWFFKKIYNYNFSHLNFYFFRAAFLCSIVVGIKKTK